MKAILYVVAILAAGGASYFTLEHSRKFTDLQKVRLDTISENKQVTANADLKEKELKDERAVLVAAQQKRDELTQAIDTLKSAGKALERDVADLDGTLGAQKQEFAELEKTMKEVAEILKALGDDINIDNLPEKIAQVEQDKKDRQAKLEELETLVASAEQLLAKNSDELDRLVKRKVDRDARIGRNSMESVITAVNQDWGFLVIGAGSNSGFTPQTSLVVERDGRFIGRVRPSAIEATQTIAEIDFSSLANGVLLQPGDRVILATPTSN
jgi:hypothetical protein